MASSPDARFTSPPISTPGSYGGERSNTPDSNLRSRFSSVHPGDEAGADASPTSTTMSGNLPRSAFRSALPMGLSSNFSTPVKKVVIRADPSLVTCFDPSDKELYDLWAPRR